jgi:steroid delta-isomerase-like uncharacterized protein
MGPTQTEQALERYADAKNRHDLDAIVAAYAEDGYYESVGLGGRIQGKAALRAFYASLFDALPDYAGRFDGASFGDDTAVVWGRFGGTLSGRLMGLDVEPGRRIDVPVSFVCAYKDGLLLSDTGYFDVATLCAQAGVPLAALHGAPDFIERFKAFWAAPGGAKVPDLIAPDAVVHWPGSEPMSGAAYPAHMDAMLKLVPGMTLEVVDHAQADDVLFIFWRAQVAVDDRKLDWTGVDRFRLRNGRAIEEFITFDTQPLRDALAAVPARQAVPPGRRATASSAAR